MRFLIYLFTFVPLLVFGKENILELTEKPAQEQQVPDPTNLKYNWWNYYHVDNETLRKRISETEKYFIQIQKSLSVTSRTSMRPFFDKFLIGLRTLANLKEQPKPLPPFAQTFPKEYAFKDWLNLGRQYQTAQSDIRENESKSNVMRLSVRSTSNYVDTLFANYLTEKKAEGEKRLTEGLEIMFVKVSLEMEQIELEQLKDKIENQRLTFQRLEKEISYSRNRINFNNVSIDEINRQINETNAKVDNNQAQLTSFYDERRRQLEKESTDVEKEIVSQHLLSLNLDRVDLKVKLINLELQKTLIRWGLKTGKDIHSIKMLEKRDELSFIKKELDDWKKESEVRFQKTLQDIALSREKKISNKERDLLQNSLKNSESIELKIQQVQGQVAATEYLINQVFSIKKAAPFSFKGMFISIREGFHGYFQTHGSWSKQSLFKLGSIPVTTLGIFKVLLILVIAYLIAKFTRRSLRRVGEKYQAISVSSLYILSRLVYYLILLVGIIVAGSSLGFDLTAFAWIAGAITVWIGFSLQSVFHNFVSGVIILLTKTVRLHDVIVLESGEVGTIVEINLRTTILATQDGLDIIVPNSDLVTKKFTNRTLSKYSRRINIPFRVALDADKEKIRKIVQEAAKAIPITLSIPEPDVWYTSYADSYIHCELAVWINEFLVSFPNSSTEAMYFNAIDNAFRENNIEIPVPYTVYLYKDSENKE